MGGNARPCVREKEGEEELLKTHPFLPPFLPPPSLLLTCVVLLPPQVVPWSKACATTLPVAGAQAETLAFTRKVSFFLGASVMPDQVKTWPRTTGWLPSPPCLGKVEAATKSRPPGSVKERSPPLMVLVPVLVRRARSLTSRPVLIVRGPLSVIPGQVGWA